MQTSIICVWAQSRSKGISKEGKISWNVPSDMQFYLNSLKLLNNGKKTAMVVGRGTYEEFGSKPLCKTIPYIVSSTRAPGSYEKERTLKNGTLTRWTEYVCNSLTDAIKAAKENSEVGLINISGGSRIYDEVVREGLADRLWVTQFGRKDGVFDTDNAIEHQPDSEDSLYVCTGVSKTEASQTDDANNVTFSIYTYEKKTDVENTVDPCENTIPSLATLQKPTTTTDESLIHPTPFVKERLHEEYQYLDLIAKIMNEGNFQMDRTKVGTQSIFGATMRYSLKDGVFPLLTTKRVFWRGVVEELLWFLKGDTNANNLSEKGVRIWDGNSSREFLDSRGLNDREVGDLGPVYGFQWRHSGAEYKTMHTDYTNKGIDQLQEVIHTLKTNPYDRRLIVCSWNPSALSDMALPPCHCLFQFYVSGDGKLSCAMYQRSADVGLGVPFNIASYALLTRMIAQCVGLEAHEFVHIMANTHVYSNHMEPLKEQLQRVPRPFPYLKINPEKKDIESFTFEDFELLGYFPYKSIAMQMAV